MSDIPPAVRPSAGRDGYDPNRPLVFVHVPKTSGTSLNNALFSACKTDRIMTAWDRCIFGDFADFGSMDPGIPQYIFRSPADLPQGIDIFTGHIAFSSYQQHYRDAQFITVLREPVCRLLSLWLFWRVNLDESLKPWGTWAARVKYSRGPLADFLCQRGVAAQTDNVALRLLLWPHPLIPEGDFIDPKHDEELVALALARLGDFAFVGILEHEFHRQLEAWLGRPLVVKRLNETPAMPPEYATVLHQELTADAHRLLAARARLDRVLWSSVALRHLSPDCAAALREETLMRSVARFATLL